MSFRAKGKAKQHWLEYGICAKLNCKPIALPWVSGQIRNQNNFSKPGFFIPTCFFLISSTWSPEITDFFKNTPANENQKTQQYKLPCFREDSRGPLIYSNAEQTEFLCSIFASSPKQLCQKLKFAFLALFIPREKQSLQRVKALLHPKFLSGSGLDSKQKEAHIGFPTPEQTFQS